MAQNANPNQAAKGSFRANTFKQPGDQKPDFIGTIEIERNLPKGTKLKFGGWKNKGQDGNSYVAFRITIPQQQAPQRQEPQWPGEGDEDNSLDLD